jgi:hypothetical protein
LNAPRGTINREGVWRARRLNRKPQQPGRERGRIAEVRSSAPQCDCGVR